MKFKGAFGFIWEILQIVVIALVIVLPIRYFIFQPFIVRGASMEPNFHNGDYLIVDEISYRFRDPSRGDIIVFKYPQDTSQRFIKRIIGLPTEQIELKNGKIIITDKLGESWILSEAEYLDSFSASDSLGQNKMIMQEDEYFVLGDNRGHSFDSRRWGVLKKEEIVGRTILRAWPLVDLSFFGAPEYQ